MNTSSAVLKVTKSGKLDLFSDKNEIIGSTNTSRSVQSPVALLLDSSNHVVKDANDGNPENFLWQSFNFPTDTFLPNQKLGGNFKTGHEVYLSAWKNDNDPTPGEFTFHIDPTGYPQALIRRGTRVSSRAGPWNDLQWNGAPAPLQIQSSIYTFQFVFNKEEVYYRYSLINNSYIQRCTWEDPLDTCDTYNLCGAYGSCCYQTYVQNQKTETNNWKRKKPNRKTQNQTVD
ncbi:G-type lectin S-receptor-like serine/threonine-protein kinase At4g27290 [Lycium ferocissimum]|uniref:G-type lectin S-receptor-like serine/threonine-protein kinase At4g27290 n=1 Tax=Lycium ferocissimum TaxID=112874 RepID=UPI0028155CD9|nr:G-type lectin S-receptor-like serine/threonine-protein kinase At4g27290 [Lycium ferocissimum]